MSPIPQLSCDNLHRKVQLSIVCRSRDDAQRSACLHVFPQNRHCQLTDEIIRGGRRRTFRAASHVYQFFLEASDLAKFQTRGGPASGLRPAPLKKLGVCLHLCQHLHGASRNPCSRIHCCRRSTGPVHKIELVVTRWSRLILAPRASRSERLSNSPEFPGTTCATKRTILSPKSHCCSTAPCEF